MQTIEISHHISLEVMPTALQDNLSVLIHLGKLSTSDISDYDGWLLAHEQDTTVLVGCVGFELRTPRAYMESLVVHPSVRKRGLGSELTRQLFDLCVVDNDNIHDLTALTLFWNNRFYESNGFKRVDPRIAKAADDVAAKEKHRYCTVWRKNKIASSEHHQLS